MVWARALAAESRCPSVEARSAPAVAVSEVRLVAVVEVVGVQVLAAGAWPALA